MAVMRIPHTWSLWLLARDVPMNGSLRASWPSGPKRGRHRSTQHYGRVFLNSVYAVEGMCNEVCLVCQSLKAPQISVDFPELLWGRLLASRVRKLGGQLWCHDKPVSPAVSTHCCGF